MKSAGLLLALMIAWILWSRDDRARRWEPGVVSQTKEECEREVVNRLDAFRTQLLISGNFVIERPSPNIIRGYSNLYPERNVSYTVQCYPSEFTPK